MRGLIKFTEVPDIAFANSRQNKLSDVLALKIFNELNYENIGAYLFDLISIDEFHHTIAAEYGVIKYMELGSTVFLSSNREDWYDGQEMIDSWFKAENPDYYMTDLNCEVIGKAIIGNYFVINLRILDIGGVLAD